MRSADGEHILPQCKDRLCRMRLLALSYVLSLSHEERLPRPHTGLNAKTASLPNPAARDNEAEPNAFAYPMWKANHVHVLAQGIGSFGLQETQGPEELRDLWNGSKLRRQGYCRVVEVH